MTAKTRAILFAAALATLLAALPALAGAPAQIAPLPAFLTAPPAPGCAGSAVSADLQAALAVPGTPSLAPAPAATNGLEGLLSQPSTKFRGFCHCSCSFVRNCNTSADCGGAACIAAITCC
jgi:hypothetical protein